VAGSSASSSLSHQPSGRRPVPGRHHGTARRVLQDLLLDADVQLDGPRPWDIRLIDPAMPERVLAKGTLGFGEAYVEGMWECDQLDELFHRLTRVGLGNRLHNPALLWHHLRARWFNLQNERRAWQVGVAHYDLGNDFFRAMLDRRMTYTCAYWHRGATTLDEAQEHKLDLVCQKLLLEKGMRVLDIGCGWGSFMRFAAERYGVQCVGVTISAEQAALGRELCAGLPVDFRLADYRSLNEPFDRVVSLGMFEHVGQKNHDAYMSVARRCLSDSGLFLLHTIGRNDTGHGTDPFIHQYVFPNGELPSVSQIGLACESHFIVEDLHNFGSDYDRTLMSWYANFEAAWPRFADQLGERFHRLWRYYLNMCAGGFRSRDIQLWQWVLSTPGRPGVYPRMG